MTNRTIDPDPIPGTDYATYRAWQAHVDAGRIGNRPPPDPAILANTDRTEQTLRRARIAARAAGGEA